VEATRLNHTRLLRQHHRTRVNMPRTMRTMTQMRTSARFLGMLTAATALSALALVLFIPLDTCTLECSHV
jgi:hypothetical protein